MLSFKNLCVNLRGSEQKIQSFILHYTIRKLMQYTEKLLKTRSTEFLVYFTFYVGYVSFFLGVWGGGGVV